MSSANVKLADVTKRFPGVLALDRVTLELRGGEILGLVGENGAGKSTLMKILSGVYPSGTFEGAVTIDGRQVEIAGPAEAEQLGVAIIHQELSAFPDLSVAENMFVGHWPKGSLGVVAWPELYAQAQKWLDAVGALCKPSDLMRDLSIGTQQLVEIAKALSREGRIIILDEPTSSLTPHEAENLFKLLRSLRAEGKALVYISHKMEEIFFLCDRIVVLRDGHSVFETPIQQTSAEKLVEHMVGRSIKNIYPPSPARSRGQTVLRVENYEAQIEDRKFRLGPISFEVHAGEIFGIGGLLGAGRSELVKAIFGDEGAKRLSGNVWFLNEPVRFGQPKAALAKGMSYVSEDRKGESIFPARSLLENTSISRLVIEPTRMSIDKNTELSRSHSRLKELNTKHASIDQEIVQLSGGNQQKVVIARAMETDARIIILDEPTRGIDVMAKAEIYEIIFELAKMGKAILLISSDLPELMALSDRIAMMKEGRIAGVVERPQFSQVGLMKLAFGTGAL